MQYSDTELTLRQSVNIWVGILVGRGLERVYNLLQLGRQWAEAARTAHLGMVRRWSMSSSTVWICTATSLMGMSGIHTQGLHT